MSGPDIFTAKKEAFTLSITFSSTLDGIDNVCRQTNAFVSEKLQCPGSELFAIQLILGEGLTNAVEHGNKGHTDKNVRFITTLQGASVKMEIQDQAALSF